MLLVALIEAASFFCPYRAKKLIAYSREQMLGIGMLLMLLKKLLYG
jgi:hypothetical protein